MRGAIIVGRVAQNPSGQAEVVVANQPVAVVPAGAPASTGAAFVEVAKAELKPTIAPAAVGAAAAKYAFKKSPVLGAAAGLAASSIAQSAGLVGDAPVYSWQQQAFYAAIGAAAGHFGLKRKGKIGGYIPAGAVEGALYGLALPALYESGKKVVAVVR